MKLAYKRVLASYCCKLGPLLFLVVGLVACDSQAANNIADTSTTNAPAVVISTSIPTSQGPTASPTQTPQPPPATASPTPSPTATFTVSPTHTPTPSPSPTHTLVPTFTPSSTPTPTDTPTPIPQPTPTGSGQTLTVPILMYHYLSSPPVGADAIRRDLSVSPENFEAQLAYLRQAGYETISLEQLTYALSQQAPLPENPILLTFDDGYRDNYEFAFPLLQKYGYTATFFIFTQPIDTYNVNYLTWEMVSEMHQAGMEFGSHSYRHPDLRDRDIDFLVYEIVGSKEAIEARIGEPVRFFAYPSGRYDQTVIEVLASAQFWGAVTTQYGSTHSYADRFELTRIRMRGDDSVQNLANKLP